MKKKTTTRFCLTEKRRFFKQKSTRPHLRSQTEEIKVGGKVFVKHSAQQELPQAGVRCLTSLVSSENLMCHRPWPIYFMPYSLPSSSHVSFLHTRSQLSTCCQKEEEEEEKKNPLGWYHVSLSLSRYLCFSPASLLRFCLSTWILDMQEGEDAQLSFCNAPPRLFAPGGTLL